ncbi:MAG: hypothetical protein C0501_25080 [Isosphaera sp.]|nr:hypothetical protein [Isosphaera sp.]
MPTLVFRSSFIVLWRRLNAWCGVGGAVVWALALASGAPLPLVPTFAVALAVGSAFAVAVVLFPVYVRADGIRCYNYCGLYQTLRWGEIAEVREEGWPASATWW